MVQGRWLVLVALLGGCATGVPVERSVVVSGARFQAVQGEADLVVRTFVEDAAGERGEVLGAVCQVRTSLYDAELTTPSRLVLPNFGPQSPELEFTCRAGELTGAARRDIITRWNQPPGYWGYPGPFYGGPWGPWGPWGAWGPAFPVSEYPDVAVRLR
jgi:hypothetical protein